MQENRTRAAARVKVALFSKPGTKKIASTAAEVVARRVVFYCCSFEITEGLGLRH